MMKTVLCSILALLFLTAHAQVESLPAQLEESVLLQYPDAVITNWEVIEDNYQASFRWREQDHHVVYSPTGEWLETRSIMRSAELPLAVQEAFRESRYNIWHVENVTQVQYPDRDRLYRYYLIKDGTPAYIEIDTDGNIVEY